MAPVEERIARVEAHVEEQATSLAEVKIALGDDARSRDTIQHLDDKLDRRFMWLGGIQVAGMLGVVAAMASACHRG